MTVIELVRKTVQDWTGKSIVMLPSNRQQGLIRSDGLDRLGVPHALERLGARVSFLDVHDFPLNPLAGKPSLFSSIDPWRALNVLFRHRKAAVVVSYYQSGALLVLALRRLMGFKPRVVIVDIGDDTTWRVRAHIVAFCIARADAVYTFASEQAAYLRRKYAVKTVHFLPQQVDTRFFTPAAEDGDYLLSVGGDVSRDFALLEESVYPLGVPVVLRTHLAKPDRTRWPHIEVMSARQSDDALKKLYQNAKAVLLPLHDTLHPGGITTLLEAFACGKPVVTSLSRGIRDYLRPEENCLAVPCGDAAAFRTAVMRLLTDKALREKIGQGARNYAVTELSQDRHARRLLDALGSLA